MNNDNNGSSGNKGNRGRFTDRLKKMRISRLNKKKNSYSDVQLEDKKIKSGLRNVSKVFLVLPSVVYSNIKSTKTNDEKKNVFINNRSINIEHGHVVSNTNSERLIVSSDDARKIRINKIKEIDISFKKKIKEKSFKNKENVIFSFQSTKTINDEIKIRKLQKEIIDLIKKKLVKSVNELEILQSELYILNNINNDDIYLSNCQQDIKEIKKLLSKIKALKEKYDYLKDNVDFEYMLEYADDILIDKILELKELSLSDDVKYVVDNYKLLDEYKFLYLKIDKLQENTIKYEEYKNNKSIELKQRDIDFEQLKNDVYDIDRDKDSYERFVKEQEDYLNNLEEKFDQINSYEKTTYKLKGFNKLLGNSFKYLGLLLISPLKGFVPAIATQTIVTKNVINNLYNNLEWDESKKMVYETIDYSTEINSVINNLDSISSLLDSTLEEVISLKSKYMENFKQYENSIYGYRDAIKKINKIENALLGNKIKIALYKERMIEKEKENENKIKMVKKLNSSSNN